MRPVAAIGIGNLLLADEGIGVHVIQALEARAEEFPDVDFLDLGAGGIVLLHVLAGRRKAVIIDCAFMDEAPGTIRRFTPDGVASVKQLSGFSLHEGDLLHLLEMARKLDQAPKEVVIFGVQPADISPGWGLSRVLQARMEEYVARVIEEARPTYGAVPE